MNKKFFILIFFNLFSCTSCSGSQISDTTLSRALQQKEKFDNAIRKAMEQGSKADDIFKQVTLKWRKK